MAAEIWWKHPTYYFNECLESGVFNFVWERTWMDRQHVDPVSLPDIYVPSNREFRSIVFEQYEPWAYEVRRRCSEKKPSGVYPVWRWDESPKLLRELLKYPVGQDARLFNDMERPTTERPVAGQEHRVLIWQPRLTWHQGMHKRFYPWIADLQMEFPEAKLHLLRSTTSWNLLFARDYAAVTVDPFSDARKFYVILPSGRKIPGDDATKHLKWVHAVGFTATDLRKEDSRRILFNMASARWAARHFNKNEPFGVGKPMPLPKRKRPPAMVADKFLCEQCSLKDICKYYRYEGVCSIPGSETAALARFFKTRDSGKIIEGLGEILGTQAQRLEEGREKERETGELDREVSRILGDMFDKGERLAKLIDPSLIVKPSPVQIGIINGASRAVSAGPRPSELAARIAGELEAKGVKRDDITEEMILEVAGELEA